jgi:hypothetical protein
LNLVTIRSNSIQFMKSHFKMNNLKKPTYSHHDKLRGQSESNLFSYAEIKIDNVINLLIHVTTHSKIFEKSYLCK